MLKAIIIDDSRKASWDDFVMRHPDAIAWHVYDWWKVLHGYYGLEYFPIAAMDGAEVRGILPLYRVRTFRSGTALISIPYVVAGGIVADDAEAEHLLLEEALRLSRSMGDAPVTLKQYRHRVAGDLHTDQGFYNLELAIGDGLRTSGTISPRKTGSRSAARRRNSSSWTIPPPTCPAFAGPCRVTSTPAECLRQAGAGSNSCSKPACTRSPCSGGTDGSWLARSSSRSSGPPRSPTPAWPGRMSPICTGPAACIGSCSSVWRRRAFRSSIPGEFRKIMPCPVTAWGGEASATSITTSITGCTARRKAAANAGGHGRPSRPSGGACPVSMANLLSPPLLKQYP